MAIINPERHQIIKTTVMQRPEDVLAVTIDLWERLASELISIIGEGGFQALYSRSIHLTHATSPWLVLCHPPEDSPPRFAGLKMCFEGRSCAEVSEASIALLNNFTDILAALIGEPLTTGILRSAWGDDAVDIAVKEARS